MMESIAGTTRTNSLQDIESYLTDFNKEIAEQTQGFAYNPVDGTLVATGPLYSTDDGVVYQTAAVPVEFKQEGAQVDQRGKQLQQPVMGTIRVSGGGIEILTANGSDGSQDTSFALAATIPDDGYQEQSGMVAQMQVSGLQDVTEPVDGHREDPAENQLHPGLSASGSYQTVTIVPSEVNQSGEVSYMLIVSQPDDDKAVDSSADMSVFDFKEEAMKAENVQSAEEGRRPKATARSSQSAGMPMQLMCNYCNYTSPKRFLLARHMRAHSEERPYNCATCGRTFKTPVALQNHVNTHKGIRPNKCKECNASFTTSGELIRHVRYRHTYEKPHKCSECDYASVELSKLKRHVRSHTGERPFQCPHCMYASPDSFKLKRHLRVHTGEKPYVCDICDMHFTQSNSLKSHKLIHSGNKPVFQCELCPTTCGRKTDLKNHVLKIHTSDRPLQCKKCGKSFPDRYTYKIHMRTHDGQKCFRCELCPYSALMQRHLESHILTHTGEKPFRCESCDQSFRQKQLLKRHNNLYHNPGYVPPVPRSKRHICKECGKVFAHQGNMLRHLAMHDPDNAEYQHAIQNGDASMGEEEEEEEEEENEEEDGSHHQGDGISTSYEDQYLTHQQPIQVQLVPVHGEEGQQVYIQIDSSQMGLLRQMEAAAVGEDQGDAALQAQSEPELTPMTPVRRGRGRPRKTAVQPPEDSDEDYTPVSTPRRGRGRPPKTNKFTRPGTRGRRRVIIEEEEEEDGEEEEEEEAAADGEEDVGESGDIQQALEDENYTRGNISGRKRPAEESSRENSSKRLKRESSSPTLEFDVSS